jgi:hypothetical protein
MVCASTRGDSPERILERYPMLGKSARVYGAIAFYLDHQAEINDCRDVSKREFEASAGPSFSETNPALWERLPRARYGCGRAAALIRLHADADLDHDIVLAVRRRDG